MKEEDLIDDIINRYGDVINLKETPHLITEIIRRYGTGSQVTDVPDGGVSVAGVGTPPGPAKAGSSLGNVVDNTEIMKEVLKLSRHVATLTEEIRKTRQ